MPKRVIAGTMRPGSGLPSISGVPRSGGASPESIATLVAAAGDGLLLHTLLDPELDITGAIEALRVLLHQKARPSRKAVTRAKTAKG